MKHPLTAKKEAQERLTSVIELNQFQLFDDLLINQAAAQLNFLKKMYNDKDTNPSILPFLKDLISVRKCDLEVRICDLHVISMPETILLSYFNADHGS